MSELRRFFFDDGSSRKRWHVQVNGKSQVVEYGRLGGSLRPSKKSFKTPAEAAENTKKLITSKRRSGYIEINPSRLEIVRSKGRKAATEKQVQTLERRLGCALPDEYRSFLRTHNGGDPNPDCVALPGVAGFDNVGVGSLFHLDAAHPVVNELVYELKALEAVYPKGHLPIAGSSDVFTLSLKPKTFGGVFWWNHETDTSEHDEKFVDSDGYLLAGSFDEFLTRIAVLFGDDEQEDEGGTPPTKTASSKKKSSGGVRRLLKLMNHKHTPAVIKEIEQVVREVGDLSAIKDGTWPFTNILDARLLGCLLSAGLNPEITDSHGHSLLWQCACRRECIDLLVERGVKIDRRSGGDHETALMRAIYSENIEAVKRLLQLGANPTVRLSWLQDKLDRNVKLRKIIERARGEWQANKQNNKSQPAVVKSQKVTTESKTRGPKPTIKRLLQLMKHDHLTDEDDAVEEIVELIEELGDVSGIQDRQWPSIDKFESPRLLSCLLEAGLHPEILDKAGNTLLSQCVVHPECIDLLLERGVAVDRRSGRNKETALMRATYMGDEECVQRLLDAGANPTLEFSIDAQILLEMDDDMTELIEAARDAWKRNKRSKQVKKKKK